MGDRVSVYFHVLKEHVEQAKEIFLQVTGDGVEAFGEPTDPTLELYLDSVNYADVGDESLALANAGIPHTYSHDGGGSFDEGYGYCLFTKSGEKFQNYFTIREENYPIEKLLEELDHLSKEDLKAKVQNYRDVHSHKELGATQLKNSKAFLLRQAVTS